MNIELTDQEATALVQLIDLAVKAGGLQVAEAGIVLTRKIQEAGKANASDGKVAAGGE